MDSLRKIKRWPEKINHFPQKVKSNDGENFFGGEIEILLPQ